jgi:hypothetical protein
MVLFSGEPSSKDFDITLMICLLRNLIPIDIMDRLPSATDTSLAADLSRIKYYRNIIVLCNSALVADTDFESYWNDVTPVIYNNFTFVLYSHQLSIGIRLLKRHIISVMSKSFDEGSPENNTIKILHEILKCLLTSGLMKITQ